VAEAKAAARAAEQALAAAPATATTAEPDVSAKKPARRRSKEV